MTDDAITRQLAEIAQQLAQIEQALHERIAVERVVLDAEGHEVGRIFRGYFYREGKLSSPGDTWISNHD